MKPSPTSAEIERLRGDFVAYQFKFHQFSDYYSVVAQFAWEKVQEALQAIEAGTAKTEGLGAKHESAVGNADAAGE